MGVSYRDTLLACGKEGTQALPLTIVDKFLRRETSRLRLRDRLRDNRSGKKQEGLKKVRR